MIRWCLSLRHQSQKAYDKVREVLHLPSHRTLRDYTHYCTGNPGFSTAVDEQLMSAAGIDSLAEWQKCVFILIDEMHIKENLVYDKHSGSVIGFTNLGDINNELLSFEQEFEQGISQPDKPLAKTILTLWCEEYLLHSSSIMPIFHAKILPVNLCLIRSGKQCTD